MINYLRCVWMRINVKTAISFYRNGLKRREHETDYLKLGKQIKWFHGSPSELSHKFGENTEYDYDRTHLWNENRNNEEEQNA